MDLFDSFFGIDEENIDKDVGALEFFASPFKGLIKQAEKNRAREEIADPYPNRDMGLANLNKYSSPGSSEGNNGGGDMGFFDSLLDNAGGILSAGAGILGSVLGSKAQSEGIQAASATSSQASSSAIASQERMLNQMLGLQEPFRQAGVGALPGLQSMSRENLEPRDVKLSELYRLQQEEGEKSINRAAAGRGGFGSTATVERLSDFNRMLLAEEVERDYARQERTSDRQYGRLLDLVNVGRGAATTQGSAGISTGQGIANTQMQGGNTLADLQSLQGSQRASTYANLAALPIDLKRAGFF